MNRRQFLAASAAATTPLSFAQAPSAAGRPNVILIMTDDQGYGDLSAHGNPALKTPNLDRLRSESVRFTDFHVTPMCTPTRSQLMTGRDALANGAMNVSSGRAMLRRGIPTMANLFAAGGYRTGIFGKWHLGDTFPYRPEDRGFQEAVGFPSSHIGSAPDAWNNDYQDDTYMHNGKRAPYKGYCTDVFFDEATRWIRASGDKPFFAYIPTNAPHGPLFVPDKYKEPYRHLAPALASFFGMIANIDENIGKLEASLTEAGLRENTIVVFLTDNGATAGFTFYNAGMRGQKTALWEGGHRTPLFLRWPGKKLAEPRDIDELTTVQDILPTLSELCGLAGPATGLNGISLAPLLRGVARVLPDRNVVIQFGRMNVGCPEYGDAVVLWKKWRLVSLSELYDIAKDPAQKDNVIEKNPALAERLRAHYDAWWAQVQPRLSSFEPVYIGAPEENPVMLSPTEWADSFFDQGVQIRTGLPRNGVWHINVVRGGPYEFVLRRWPKGVDVSLRAELPAHKGEWGGYPAGVALPVASAELSVAGRIVRQKSGAADKEVVFQVPLPEGRNRLQATFFDDAGRELCGAYYVYARYTGA
ncbi:MAG: arylsulfatase [Bryobacteraceae bacterium]|nr:arylsulfatase [Bryobacteraceae bacterium]